MFKLKNVTKDFIGEETVINAVDNVTLTIKPNEIFGVIGPSGAGKSTLIRCLNLLEYPDAGEVIFKGKNLLELSKQEIRETRKHIGMVFQNFNLLASRTVFENVAFPINNKNKKTVKNKVNKLLEIVGISDKAYAYPNQLSGGQKQRVAIARALANDPDVLLCDEATSALDPQTTKSILALLKKLNRDLDLTIILITHEMEVIKSICDRVAIMDDGKIVEVDKVINIFTNPSNDVTKNFVQENFNLDDIYSLVDKNDLVGKDGYLFELIYGQKSSSEALISSLVKKYDLEINIIAGSIEIISSQSVGHLVIVIKGSEEMINRGKDFLCNHGVLVKEVTING